ncbi:hypothetical protein Hanom_Chr06g00537921 [Helianthus anomalus]
MPQKNILELTYQASSTTLNDQNPQEDLISKVEKLRRLVKSYWIMAETGSAQFVMASNALSSASCIICAISMLMYMYMALRLLLWGYSLEYGSILKSHIQSFCIGIQKVIVVSCKIIVLIPIVVIILVIYCLHYFKSLEAMLFTPWSTPTPASINDTNQDLSKYFCYSKII